MTSQHVWSKETTLTHFPHQMPSRDMAPQHFSPKMAPSQLAFAKCPWIQFCLVDAFAKFVFVWDTDHGVKLTRATREILASHSVFQWMSSCQQCMPHGSAHVCTWSCTCLHSSTYSDLVHGNPTYPPLWAHRSPFVQVPSWTQSSPNKRVWLIYIICAAPPRCTGWHPPPRKKSVPPFWYIYIYTSAANGK